METHKDSTEEPQPRRRLDFEHDKDKNIIDIESYENKESLHIVHPNIPTNEPKIGMEFETEEQAYQFYNTYALDIGFSVRKSKFHTSGEKLLDRLFVCSREGKRGPDKRDDAYKSHRPETRCLCPAKLKINCRQTGKYRVEKFVSEHNHNLTTPSKTHHFRSHRKMSLAQAAEIDMIESSGIAPKSGFDYMAQQGGGRESVGFTHIDYKNHLQTKRTLAVMAGDTGGVLEYLQRKQIEDPNFFYAIQVDEDDLITNIFWADAKMMADYEDFGDVVCFDTTYRKHKDGRPIALFVGVNHHKQTTIFGAALLYDETAASFMWLFDTFAKAMDGKLPKTILTDQDAAMAKALATQWPMTYHRLCVWHIFQNAAIHLSHVFAEFKDFSKDFSSCVYDFEDETEFLNAWAQMLTTYNLESNDWLKRMLSIKEKWALVYGRDTFCADMTTTQRSESMNKVIKHYISYKHDLRRFFLHFERLLNDRRYNERMADFKADQSKVVLPFPVEILKHAASVYTPIVFKLFQDELSKSYDCIIVEQTELETLSMYTICPYQKHHRYNITFDTGEEVIRCTCRKFEFGGILCCHALKVFCTRGITRIPEKYILKRWTKGTRNGGGVNNLGNASDVDPRIMVGRRYRELCRLAMRLSTRAAENEHEYLVVKETLVKLNGKIGLHKEDATYQSSSNFCGVSKQADNVVVDSTGITKIVKGIKAKSKAGNSSKRPKGALEKARKSKTKQKVSSNEGPNPASLPIKEVNYSSVSQPDSQIVSSDIFYQPPQASHEIHSYQALLEMDYPIAESLMYPFLDSTHHVEKAQPHQHRERQE